MTIDCLYWNGCGVSGGGCCKINEYQRPSFGVCLLQCKKNTDRPDQKTIHNMLGLNKSRGLGDTVKKVIDKVTRGKVKPCGGCKKRQERLNKLLPYKGDKNGR